MGRILRGDVFLASLDSRPGFNQDQVHPIVILSQGVFNERSGTVVAMMVTEREQRAGYPLVLELKSVLLPRRAWVKISQIRTISVENLGKKIGQVLTEELEILVEGLNEIISS